MTRKRTHRFAEANAGRVQLHSALYAGMGQVISATVLLVGFGSLLLATSGFRRWEPAPIFAAITGALIFAWIMSARLRLVPLAYGDREGLDLEWAWGDKRHIAWSELRELRVHRVSGIATKRFRLYLEDEVLEFYARSDLPELVTRWSESPPG